ncbi:hypothetical protein [uncultured Dokdonia sp.]|jgi:hypothetical protein|uniref:hypothetical protein n=1 Tax=unclassified Dokdonia TaxID=2615033 RepID=UPI00260776BB|nr:hypothetical protein [uncultured Dokdonia sp.]
MLKNILKLEGVKPIEKKEQGLISGGLGNSGNSCPKGFCRVTDGSCQRPETMLFNDCID